MVIIVCFSFHNRSIASNMRDIQDPSDFLLAPTRFILNTTIVKQTVDHLLPSKAVIFVGSQEFAHTPFVQDSAIPLPEVSSSFSKEPIYGTKYQVNGQQLYTCTCACLCV